MIVELTFLKTQFSKNGACGLRSFFLWCFFDGVFYFLQSYRSYSYKQYHQLTLGVTGAKFEDSPVAPPAFSFKGNASPGVGEHSPEYGSDPVTFTGWHSKGEDFLLF
jgi:hypothetical protein